MNYKSSFSLRGVFLTDILQNLHNLKTELWLWESKYRRKKVYRARLLGPYIDDVGIRTRGTALPGRESVPTPGTGALLFGAPRATGTGGHWQRWKEAKIWTTTPTTYCGTKVKVSRLITRFSPSAFGDPKSEVFRAFNLRASRGQKSKKNIKTINFIYSKHQTKKKALLEINNKQTISFDVTWRKSLLHHYSTTRYCQELKCIIAHNLFNVYLFLFFKYYSTAPPSLLIIKGQFLLSY